MSFQIILIGLAEGSIYGLVATPIILVYRMTGVANFAQGAMAAFCCFILYSLLSTGLPVFASLLLAFCFSLLLGVVVFGCMLVGRKLGTLGPDDHTTPLIVTLGLYEILNSLMVLVWSANPRELDFLRSLGSWKWTIWGGVVTAPQLISIACLVAIAFIYYVIVQKTAAGLVLRASATDDEAAEVIGINTNKVRAAVWAVGSAIGLIAGSLASSMIYLSPDLMNSVILKAFVAAIIGGMNSVRGAMLGGLVLGLATALAGALVGTDVKDALAVGFAAIILLAFPRGLLGQQPIKRV